MKKTTKQTWKCFKTLFLLPQQINFFEAFSLHVGGWPTSYWDWSAYFTVDIICKCFKTTSHKSEACSFKTYHIFAWRIYYFGGTDGDWSDASMRIFNMQWLKNFYMVGQKFRIWENWSLNSASWKRTTKLAFWVTDISWLGRLCLNTMSTYCLNLHFIYLNIISHILWGYWSEFQYLIRTKNFDNHCMDLFFFFLSEYFGEKTIFSLIAVVSKPLQVDLAIKNQTRLSCSRVKVKVDLLSDFPKCIKIEIKKGNGKVLEQWIQIKYDHFLKYCKTCMIQGHDEN